MSSCEQCASFVHRALKDIRKGRRMALHVLQILYSEHTEMCVLYLLCDICLIENQIFIEC